MSDQLASKELTLAKSFGIIRKLESMLGEILPESMAGIGRDLPGFQQRDDAPAASAAVETPAPHRPAKRR